MSTPSDPTERTSAEESGPTGTMRCIAFLAAALPFAYMVHRFRFLTDDGFITFRYSRNFAEGHGLVYNLGADPPVEGYSEFLWAVLLGLGIRLGWDPEWFSQVLSISAGALMIALMASLIARWFHDRPVTLVGTALLVGSAPPLGVWATGGMATMASATLGVWLFWLLERMVRRSRSLDSGAPAGASGGVSIGGSAVTLSLCASLAALMRADAALFVALVLGPAILAGLLQRKRALWGPPLAAAFVSAAVFGAHVAWRWSVYGDWLPNTARVKVGMSARALDRGLDYVLSNACSMPGLGFAFVGGLVGAAFAMARHGLGVGAVLVSMIVGVTGYAAAAGGDFMAYARFLVPAVPFAVLGLGALVAAIEARTRVLAGLIMAGVISTSVMAAYGGQLVPIEVRKSFTFRHNQRGNRADLVQSEYKQWVDMKKRAEVWAVTGRALKEHTQPGESLVAGAIGAIGYYSNLFIYDRHGLVTREVALREPNEKLRSPGHDKVVPKSFFDKDRPTYSRASVAEEGRVPRLKGAAELGPTERKGQVLWVVRGPGR